MPEPLEIQAKITGNEQVKRQLNGIAASEEKVGTKGKAAGDEASEGHEKARRKAGQHGKELSGIAKLYGNLKRGAVAWLGGLATFGTVLSQMRQYVEYLREARNIQRELAGQAETTQGGLHGLAVQFGNVSPEGFSRARKAARGIGVAGGFDQNTATQLAISLDVALAKRGGLLENMDVGKKIAGAAGALNLKGDEAGKLVELLNTMGALESPEKMDAAVAKIMAAQNRSQSTQFGAFASMMQQGGTGMLNANVNPNDVLQYAVMMRQVTKSEDVAGTAMSQLFRASIGASGGKTWRDYLTKEAKSRGINWTAMGTGEKIRFLGGLLSEAKTPEQQQRLLEAGLPGEVSTVLFSAFSAKNIRATAKAKEDVTQASGADVDKLVSGYKKTLLYKERATDVGLKYDVLAKGDMKRKFKLLEDEAKAEYREYAATYQTGYKVDEELFVESYIMEKMKQQLRGQPRGQKLLKELTRGPFKSTARTGDPADRLAEMIAPHVWAGAGKLIGMSGGAAPDEWLYEKFRQFNKIQNQTSMPSNIYIKTGGTDIHQDGRRSPINNGPGRNRIGSGDNTNFSR